MSAGSSSAGGVVSTTVTWKLPTTCVPSTSDAQFTVDSAEDHELEWYAVSELDELI